MLDMKCLDIVREIRNEQGSVVGMIPDIRLGGYTPLPEIQNLCVGDAIAELGAEKTSELTKQLEHVGILNAFMYYVKTFHATPLSEVETRSALRLQMQKMRSLYPDVLMVSTDGRKSSELDFFKKAEDIMKTIAQGELRTPIDLMGVLMTAYAQYSHETNEDRKSFLARGILTGIETLRGSTTNAPLVTCLLKMAAQRKAYEIKRSYRTRRLKSKQLNWSKGILSVGRWFDSTYKYPPISYGSLSGQKNTKQGYRTNSLDRYRYGQSRVY